MKDEIENYTSEIFESLVPYLSEETTAKEKEAIRSRIRSSVRNTVIDTVQKMKDAIQF